VLRRLALRAGFTVELSWEDFRGTLAEADSWKWVAVLRRPGSDRLR